MSSNFDIITFHETFWRFSHKLGTVYLRNLTKKSKNLPTVIKSTISRKNEEKFS